VRHEGRRRVAVFGIKSDQHPPTRALRRAQNRSICSLYTKKRSPVCGAVGGCEDPVGQDERAAAQVGVVDDDQRLPRELAAQRRRSADDLAANHLAQFARRRG
jgi:hypothetical protein